ncbi:hypothetical protein [uncultured Jatrophihabitans sp.]|uniref:hypothetical protein n=1 Tax=uncultured Jatrophihabitans sp. TaxID=1610747 RepID=UPI0035CAA388
MQPPPEPSSPGTSLDLTAGEGVERPAVPTPGTGLELPPSEPPTSPTAAVEATTPVEAAAAPAPGPLGNLVVAHFRRVEIAMLGRVLVATLSGALPASMVTVERRRSLGRLVGRSADPVGVTVTAGERVLTFRAPEVGVVEASVGHIVRGVVLSSTAVPVAQWLDELGVVLNEVTRADEATRTALERALTS